MSGQCATQCVNQTLPATRCYWLTLLLPILDGEDEYALCRIDMLAGKSAALFGLSWDRAGNNQTGRSSSQK